MNEWIAKPIMDGRKCVGDEYMGELIRCKDCIYWNYEDSGIDGTEQGECCSMDILSDGMFYCAGAERKDNG